MNLLEQIDVYCERMTFSFWAEPFNAWSNLAILVAGLLGFYWLSKPKCENPWSFWLSVTAVVVSVGSFLFHTFATVWAMWGDILPIVVFMLVFFSFTLLRIFKLSVVITALILTVFMGVGALLKVAAPSEVLSGSLIYSHALLSLIVVALLMLKQRHFLRFWYLQIALLFILSLSFRSLDAPICENFPLGTHFIWHSLNGVMIAVIIYATVVWHRNHE